MAKKIFIPAKIHKIRIVNRCILCGRVVPPGRIICESCERKQRQIFRR